MVNPSASFWSGKRVLLTGHTGFKGGWCALWLGKLGAEVFGLALDPADDGALWCRFGRPGGIDSLGDIRDQSHVASVFSRAQPEVVIHMAAQALVRRSHVDPAETFAINVLGLVHVLDAARACKSVRAIVNVTSDKCYENNGQIWPYREDDRLGGRDPYSASKACAELVTSSYRQTFFSGGSGPWLASARAGNVIGGGDISEGRLVPDCLREFHLARPVLIRNPHSVRPWQHVLEPIQGYLTLAQALFEQGDAFAGAWNFGPGELSPWTVADVVRHLAAAWGTGAEWHKDEKPHPYEAPFLRVDINKAVYLLGWRPRLSTATALDWTVEWTRAANTRSAIEVSLAQVERFELVSAQNEAS